MISLNYIDKIKILFKNPSKDLKKRNTRNILLDICDVLEIIYISLNNYIDSGEELNKILYLEIIKKEKNIAKIDSYYNNLILSIDEYLGTNTEILLIFEYINEYENKINLKKFISIKKYLWKKLGHKENLKTNLDNINCEIKNWLIIIEDLDFLSNIDKTKVIQIMEYKLSQINKNYINVSLSNILKVLMEIYKEENIRQSEVINNAKDKINKNLKINQNNFNNFINNYSKDNNLTLARTAVKIKDFSIIDINNENEEDNSKINLEKEINNLDKILYKEKKIVNNNEFQLNTKVKNFKKLSENYNELYNLINFINGKYEQTKNAYTENKNNIEDFQKKFKNYDKELTEFNDAFNLYNKYKTLKNIN